MDGLGLQFSVAVGGVIDNGDCSHGAIVVLEVLVVSIEIEQDRFGWLRGSERQGPGYFSAPSVAGCQFGPVKG